jgi:hypothetical protein
LEAQVSMNSNNLPACVSMRQHTCQTAAWQHSYDGLTTQQRPVVCTAVITSNHHKSYIAKPSLPCLTWSIYSNTKTWPTCLPQAALNKALCQHDQQISVCKPCLLMANTGYLSHHVPSNHRARG